MNLKKILGLQTQSEKLAEYLKLSRELEKVGSESQLLADNYSLNKSQMDSLNGEKDPFVVKSITSRFEAFLKQHQKDVVSLCNRKVQIEKSMQNIEKDENLAEVIQDYKQILEVKKSVKTGTISKAIYYDLLKAKEGVVRYADVLLFKGDKLLILQRANNGMFSDKWCVPGGHVDPGEDFLTAAQRELFEETGIDIPKAQLSEAAVYKDKDVEIHYFIGNMNPKDPGVVIIDSSEEIGSAWITPLDIDDYEFIFDMKDNLKRILGIEQEDCCVQILKAFTEGNISEKVFKEFCETHKDDIRKSQNKTNFTHKERKDLAEKGEAMPNGKYPIRNSQDLKDAIRLVGASDMPESKVKAWIKKRAKELNLEKELPESWDTSDSEIEKAEDTETAQILSKEDLSPKVVKPQGSGIGDDGFEKSGTFDVEIGFNDLDQAEMFKSLVEEWKASGKLDVASVITKGFEDDLSKTEDPMKKVFNTYLNFIEGAKTRLKNIHWTEKDSAKHINLDELSEEVSEFEDKLSEASQANFGRFTEGQIQGDEVEESDPIKICDLLYEKTKELRKKVENNDDYNGEISWIDDFLISLKQSKYRLQMH